MHAVFLPADVVRRVSGQVVRLAPGPGAARDVAGLALSLPHVPQPVLPARRQSRRLHAAHLICSFFTVFIFVVSNESQVPVAFFAFSTILKQLGEILLLLLLVFYRRLTFLCTHNANRRFSADWTCRWSDVPMRSFGRSDLFGGGEIRNEIIDNVGNGLLSERPRLQSNGLTWWAET